MESFKHELNIKLSLEKPPIRFVHHKNFAQPQSFMLHLNDCVELYIFVSGEADYIVEDRYIKLNKGDVLAISPHEIHVPVLRNECEYERFYLLLPLDTFSGLAFDPLQSFLKSVTKASPKLNLTDGQKCRVLELLYEISRLSATENNELAAAGLTLQLLGLLTESTFDPTHAEETSGAPELLRNILRYISINPEKIQSINDLAAHFHISAPYLSSLFKKYVGVSAGNYLRIKKTALAKQLLQEGRSVTETCYECGFSDSSHFIKTFKSFVGMTPNQYKNMYLKKVSS